MRLKRAKMSFDRRNPPNLLGVLHAVRFWVFILAIAMGTGSSEARDTNVRTHVRPGDSGNLEIVFEGNPLAPYRLLSSPDLIEWRSVLVDTTGGRERAWAQPLTGSIPVFYEVVPEALPFDLVALQAAAEYSRLRGGAAVLVLQNGEIVFEDYHNGATAETATHVQSGTKAFFACAVAAAIEDGLISGYDEKVAETITEWQDALKHPGKSLITIGMLASLSSGLSQDVDQIQGTDPLADDLYNYAVHHLRLTSMPGSSFQYGPSHYYAFGVLLQRKLAQAGRDLNPLEYLEERVLAPIGLEYTHWQHDDAGNPHIPNGATLTPRNWIKLGRFLLQHGSWEGRPVIDPGLMADLLSAAGPNPGHGRFLWLNHPEGYPPNRRDTSPPGSQGGFIYHDGHPELFAAMGAGKNRLYVVPVRNAVILRQTTGDTQEFIDTEFLAILLGDP